MSEQLYVCENADRCWREEWCKHATAHLHNKDFNYLCDEKCNKGVIGSTCVPVATERGTSDTDAVLARSLANDDDVVCDWSIIKPLLLRLADKVEGKS